MMNLHYIRSYTLQQIHFQGWQGSVYHITWIGPVDLSSFL